MQLLPFCDLLAHSHRDRTFSVVKWAMPSWGWGNFLVPLFHCFETAQGPFFQSGQEFFTSYYLGAGLMALSLWGLWRARSGRMWILGTLSVIAVLLAMGENGFVYPVLKRFLPLVGIARYPIKFVILPAFALPLMAALAFSRVTSSPALRALSSPAGERDRVSAADQRCFLATCAIVLALMVLVLEIAKSSPLPYDQWPATLRNGVARAMFLAAFGGCVLLLANLARPKWSSGLSLALLVIVFADALTHTAQQNPSVSTSALAPGLWQTRSSDPPPRHGTSRVFITPQAEERLLFNRVRNASDQFLGERMALWSNLNLLDDIPKVNGSSTLQIREQMLLQKKLYEQTNSFPTGLLDFLGVSHLSSPENLVEWNNRTNYCSFISGGQKPEFLEDDTALQRLMEESFDPRKTVFLPMEERDKAEIKSMSPVAITNAEISANQIRFQASANEPGVCVISQSFYHCWMATIDGKPTGILRANVAFQAVIVPAGTHQIVLNYRDQLFQVGLAISVATALICLLFWRIAVPPKKAKAAWETQAA